MCLKCKLHNINLLFIKCIYKSKITCKIPIVQSIQISVRHRKLSCSIVLFHKNVYQCTYATASHYFNKCNFTDPHNNNNNLRFSSLGYHFLSITGDKFHSDTIESAFKELHSEVDAVFSYEGHLYMIKVILCSS